MNIVCITNKQNNANNLRIHCSHRSAIKLLAANAQSISKVSTIGNLVMTNVALFIIKKRHLEKFNYSVTYNTIERQILAIDIQDKQLQRLPQV